MKNTTINPALMAEVEKQECKFAEKYLCEIEKHEHRVFVKLIRVDMMSIPLENTSVVNDKTLAVATHQGILITYDPMDGDLVRVVRVNKPTVAEIYPKQTRNVSKELFEIMYNSGNLEDSYEYLKLILGL